MIILYKTEERSFVQGRSGFYFYLYTNTGKHITYCVGTIPTENSIWHFNSLASVVLTKIESAQEIVKEREMGYKARECHIRGWYSIAEGLPKCVYIYYLGLNFVNGLRGAR